MRIARFASVALVRAHAFARALLLAAAIGACGGPLAHVETDARWLDPYTGRASPPIPARAADDPVRIAVYGDVRGERERHRAVVAAIRAQAPDLVVFTGDALHCLPVAHMPDFGAATYLIPFWPQYVRGYPLVTLLSVVPFPALVHETIGRPLAPPRDADGFNGFLEDTAPLRLVDRTPYVFVPGNHDLYHRYDRREAARLFVSNEDAGRRDDELFFSVEIGGYRIHAVDTGSDLLGDDDPIGVGSRQLAWLDASLADAEKKGLRSIVALHIPPYTSASEDEPSPVVRDRIGRGILDRHDVALVVGGHAHAYERIERPGKGGRMVAHVVTGGGGAPFHHEAPPNERDPGSKVFVEGKLHFVLLELARGEIRGTMRALDEGSPIGDEFVVRLDGG